MLKRSITYKNFNGDEETEDFYFNLTKAELIELEMGHDGGLSEALKEIVRSKDGAQIMLQFKEIILKAYGERSPDGRRFVKTPELRAQFESTEAYSELFVLLVTDAEAAAEFVQGIMPGDLMKEAQLRMETEMPDMDALKDAEEALQGAFTPPAEPKIISWEEADAMDPAQRQAGLNSGSIKIQLTHEQADEMDPFLYQTGMSQGYFVLVDGVH